MAKFDCNFCKALVRIKDMAILPAGWGIITTRQGKARLDFRHCPEHEKYKKYSFWELVDREKPTAPTKDDPTPF